MPETSPGFRRRLSKYAACQPSYVTRVMNRVAHFSLEQGIMIANGLGLSEDESSYFLLLLQRDRAGTSILKDHFTIQLDAAREKQLRIVNVLNTPPSLEKPFEQEYYSSWLYIAIHVLVAFADTQDEIQIAKRLGISIARAREILKFLEHSGAVRKSGKGLWKLGRSSFHLGKNSASISSHHTNWRMQAIASLDRVSENDLHYSVVFGVSKKDWEKIRMLLLKCIKDSMSIVSPSKEEVAGCLNLDLFGI